MDKYAVFTMDVESFADTECVSNSGEYISADLLDGFDEYIRILDKHNIKGTLFTVGELAPKISKKLKVHLNNGHKLALHSYSHIAPMDVSVEKFESRTQKAKQMLSEMFETDIKGFRAPCFSLDKERLEVLRRLGFSYDSSHLDFLNARHTVKLDLSNYEKYRNGIFHKDGFYEFEISKQKVFGKPYPVSGGGYVRLGQWKFIKSLIWKYIRSNNYYVFYIHPFELTHQRIPFIKKLKIYDRFYINYGIKSYGKKIEKIITMLKKQGYKFVTFEELTDIMNKEQKPVR